MQKLVFTIAMIIVAFSVSAQTSTDLKADKVIAEKFFKEAKKASVQVNMITAAKFFLGKPYVGRTLEIGDKESLVVNLRELDCMTLVETCLALSRALNSNEPNFDGFTKELTKIRYRNGIIDGYTSRLHYSTDWIYDNEKMGIFKDITGQIGGKPFHPNVGFMSQNPDKYKHLKDDPKAVQQMADYEKAINSRTTYHYIPKNEIDTYKSKIKSGDIIGYTTSMKGLDISHLAIAYWEHDILTFIHASSSEMKVIINPISIADYCASIKTNTGIVVLRPKN